MYPYEKMPHSAAADVDLHFFIKTYSNKPESEDERCPGHIAIALGIKTKVG